MEDLDPHLRPHLRMLRKAYPGAISPTERAALFLLLFQEFSERNFDAVMAAFLSEPPHVALADAIHLSERDVDPGAIAAARATLSGLGWDFGEEPSLRSVEVATTTLRYRMIQSTWGIAINITGLLRIVGRPPADAEEVAQGVHLLCGSGVSLDLRDLESLTGALRRAAPLLQRAAAGRVTIVELDDVWYGPADYQEEGLEAAMVTWVFKALGVPAPEIDVTFDEVANRYEFTYGPLPHSSGLDVPDGGRAGPVGQEEPEAGPVRRAGELARVRGELRRGRIAPEEFFGARGITLVCSHADGRWWAGFDAAPHYGVGDSELAAMASAVERWMVEEEDPDLARQPGESLP